MKAKTGIGHPIFYDYYAPMKENKPNQDIDFSEFKNMQDDYEL